MGLKHEAFMAKTVAQHAQFKETYIITASFLLLRSILILSCHLEVLHIPCICNSIFINHKHSTPIR